jgi:hypothetical protein
MLEKTEVAIKNGQSRDTEDMGYTRHRTKTNKTKTTPNKGNAKRGVSPRLKIRCCDLDL